MHRKSQQIEEGNAHEDLEPKNMFKIISKSDLLSGCLTLSAVRTCSGLAYTYVPKETRVTRIGALPKTKLMKALSTAFRFR